MGSVGDTKVLPETLERTFERLRGALDALGSMADPGPGAAP